MRRALLTDACWERLHLAFVGALALLENAPAVHPTAVCLRLLDWLLPLPVFSGTRCAALEEHLAAQASEHEFLERQMTMELVRVQP